MHFIGRRKFIRLSGAAAGSTALIGLAGIPGAAASPGSGGLSALEHVRLGVATYSLRELSRADAIASVQAIGTPYVNIKSFHLDYALSPAEIAEAIAEFTAAGLQIEGGGLIPFHEDTDDAVRASFEYARAADFPVIVAGPTPEVLPRLERFAIEYDIKVAIHNHGPEDEYFPSPSDILPLIRDMDSRMGFCVDLGHTARTGKDVVRELAVAGDRLHDIHMKDLADFSDRGSQCIVGSGHMPVAAIFRQLEAMAYPGYVNLEFEIDAADPLPGMLRSFGYMRGVIAGMDA